MAVNLRESFDVSWDGTHNSAIMSIFVDSNADLAGLSHLGDVYFQLGSDAIDVSTGDIYRMKSDYTWVLQSGGGGGGGGETPEFIEVTPATGVTLYGDVVKTGSKVTWTGCASFSSSGSGDRLAFTLPEEIRPYTKYLFKCGNGGYGYDYTGYILPNGEVHIVFANSSAMAIGDFSWDVITPSVQVAVDASKVTSSTGGIQVIGTMAIMQVSLVLGSYSTGWQNSLLTIPSDVSVPQTQCPFCIYRGRNSAQYPDAWLNTNGALDIYLDRNLGNIIDVLCIWNVV